MKNQIFLDILLLWFLLQPCYAQEVRVSCYPECVQPGDTFYVKIMFDNDSEDEYSIRNPPLFFGIKDKRRHLLSRNGNDYEWLPEVQFYAHPDTKLNHQYLIQPKSQTALFCWAFQFPPLEDLHSEFWENEMAALKKATEGLDYEFQIVIGKPTRKLPTNNSNSDASQEERYGLSNEEAIKRLREAAENSLMYLKTNVRIKLRHPDEMALIEQWYENTPESLLPQIAEYTAPQPGCKVTGFLQYTGTHAESSNWIKIEGIQLSGHRLTPWHFVRLGNRYPSDPNAPETWQGWKELEESISESTMRDEIRLTRMLIQYCDTKDEKVLEELKAWFAEMNEVQRTCMAASILNRGRHELLASFRELYEVVRE